MSSSTDFDSVEWSSFWDLATPEQAAAVLFELYDSGAAPAAAGAAVDARANGREEDARFWDAARAVLHRRHPYPPVFVWPD